MNARPKEMMGWRVLLPLQRQRLVSRLSCMALRQLDAARGRKESSDEHRDDEPAVAA